MHTPSRIFLATGVVIVALLVGAGGYFASTQPVRKSSSAPVPVYADTPTVILSPPTPISPPVAATTTVSPTPLSPPLPAPVVVSTVVSLSQVTPIKVDRATWKRYVNSDEGLTLSYPPDWTAVPSPGIPTVRVGFYPPTSNPQEPSPCITLYFWPNRPLPADRPVNALVGSFRASEVEGHSIGGMGGSYDLLVAYRTGSVEFGVSHDLGLKSVLKAMLSTLTLKP